MKKNFNIRDAVLFDLPDVSVDMQDRCELASVLFLFHPSRNVEMKWTIEGSNRLVQFLFSAVDSYVVQERQPEYPIECGAVLAIAGFSNGTLTGNADELYVEPTSEMDYMSFVMNDRSAFLVRAESVVMRLI